jgi:putative heme-binding domain-containing protein
MATPHAGTFTSASGVHVHRGNALPEGHAGSVFVAESAQNLVQRQVRTDVGASFRSRPARDGQEFLASRDSWFRPVHLSTGPDGALYVVDMYRKDIDHPAYVPEGSRRLFDFTAGRDRGRIYRVAAAGAAPRGAGPGLAEASTLDLVSRLGDANGWMRDTAQRLLVERRDREALPALRGAVRDGTLQARLHALWTLDVLGALDDDTLLEAMRAGAPGVRENAVRLAETRVVAGGAVLDAVLALVDDPAPRVRLRVALALGSSRDARAVAALAAIARRDGADRWTRAAVFSGIGERAAAFLDAWASGAAEPPPSPAARAAVMQDLGRLYGAAATRDEALAFVHRVADPGAELSWQPAALAGLAQGLRGRGLASGAAGSSALLDLVAGDTPLATEARGRLAIQVERATELARLDAAPVEQRVPAIDLLGHAGATSAAPLLTLLAPSQPVAVQTAAVRAIAQVGTIDAVAGLVDRARWQAYSPRLRDAVLTTLLADDRFVGVLLDGVAAGVVGGGAIGPARARRLSAHRDPAVAARARALLGDVEAGTGMPAYARLKDEVTARAGDVARGGPVFDAQCAACHTFRGRGGRVGPDLSGIRNQPAEALLLHVVVPDYEITPGYESYTVQLRDGRTLVGRVESETGGSLTLRDAAGEAHAVLRADLVSLAASPGSLMPATFGEVLPPRALADLIAYLKQ